MTVELSRRLLAAGVPSADIEAALFLSVARGIPMARALIDRGVVSERALEDELSRWGGMPLRQVNASSELWARLPMSMCRRLGAVPLRTDGAPGSVEVAAIDPLDPHVGIEFGFHLGVPVRVQRATLGAIEEAIRRLELGETEGATTTRTRRRTPAFPHGAPRSSVPPPPAEEVPIPLVKRVSLPALPEEDDEVSLVTPRPSRTIATEANQRAVSFPSTPPPPGAPIAAPVPAVPPVDGRASLPSFGTRPLAPRRTHTPALGSMVVTPRAAARGAPTPPLGTIAAVVAPTAERAEPARDAGLGSPRVEPPGLPEPPPSPASPSFAMPPRSTTPIAASTPTPAASELLPIEVPPWATPSEAMEAGFRRASGEFALDLGDARSSVTPIAEPRESEPPPSEGDASEEPTHVRPPPLAAPRMPTMSLEEALDRLGDAQGRDAVVETALDAMRLLAPRVALFVARRDGYQGWACSREFGEEAALRAVVIPHKTPSILATAAAAGFYLGPVPSTPGHAALLALMRQVGPEVAVSVVRVAGKPAMVLIAEGLDDSMRGTKALGEIARVAGFALGRVLSSR